MVIVSLMGYFIIFTQNIAINPFTEKTFEAPRGKKYNSCTYFVLILFDIFKTHSYTKLF